MHDCNSSSSHALPHQIQGKLPWAIYLTAGRSPEATGRDLSVNKRRTLARLAGRTRAKLSWMDGWTDHVTQAFPLTESEVSCARTGAQQFATSVTRRMRSHNQGLGCKPGRKVTRLLCSVLCIAC